MNLSAWFQNDNTVQRGAVSTSIIDFPNPSMAPMGGVDLAASNPVVGKQNASNLPVVAVAVAPPTQYNKDYPVHPHFPLFILTLPVSQRRAMGPEARTQLFTPEGWNKFQLDHVETQGTLHPMPRYFGITQATKEILDSHRGRERYINASVAVSCDFQVVNYWASFDCSKFAMNAVVLGFACVEGKLHPSLYDPNTDEYYIELWRKHPQTGLTVWLMTREDEAENPFIAVGRLGRHSPSAFDGADNKNAIMMAMTGTGRPGLMANVGLIHVIGRT